MSILIHKTGVNKTLGQQSDAIVAGDLVGDFQPSVGIETAYWDNQVSGGNNIRRFNGITHNSPAPHNFEFDGTNDYLGPAESGYGGDAFQVDVDSAFTIGIWWYYDSSADNFVFGLGESGGSGFCGLKVESSDNGVELNVENDALDTGVALTNHTWYYLAVTYDGRECNLECDWLVYVNGSFAGKTDLDKTGAIGGLDLLIGAWDLGASSFSYTVADSRCGHAHIYTAALTGSQLRQNFLATHSINDNRIYGATYTAISG